VEDRMTSKLVVNTIEADTGISSVSFASSISMNSTAKFHFSAAGVDIGADTNINRPAAGVLGFNISGAEKLRIDTNGHLNTSGIVTAANFKSGVTNVHNLGVTLTGGQLDVGSNIKIGTAGVVTATSFSGSGANLTNLPVPTTITVADESSDTDCYPLFATTTSGNLAPKTGTNLVFNSSSGNLRTGSLFLGTGSNESKTQDGLILERNSGDGEVHITAGRSGGNYGGMQFYVAGGSGVTKRFQIDYQSNFRWFHSNGTTERFKIEQNGTLTSTASNNGQIIHSFKNTDTTAGSSAHTIEHWFRFNRSGGGMDSPAAKIIAGKEREWVGGASNQDGYLAFHTMLNESSAERIRINSFGQLYINTSTSNDTMFGIKNSSSYEFITCRDTSNTLKYYVHHSGNNYNTNGNYSQISDQSLKENIVDANSQWNDIKNIKIRNFNFTAASGMDTHTQIGCVAQEVETVSPKLVTAPRADGIKTVANSVLYMKAVKALQEAQARIETLEAEVAALKGS